MRFLNRTLALTLVVFLLAFAGSLAQQSPASEVVHSDFKPGSRIGNLYVVYFQEAALVAYSGDIAGLEATSPMARGESGLDARSAASQFYLAFLDQRQATHVAAMETMLGRVVEPVFRYRALANGVAVSLSSAEARQVERMPQVQRVVADTVAFLDTDRGPTWIGAPSIWDGTATGGLPGTEGEGVIVGIIDSGINMDHPSFAETGGDGFTHTNPFGSGVFVGWCDPLNPDFDPLLPCNDKLIGGWDFTDAFCAANPATCSETDGPEDDNGHGSHTAGTAAGNVLLSPEISGVAPHANVIAYDTCYTNLAGQGLCPFTATSAAADQAVLDGVDAINYSIGGGSDPWGGDIDTFFLDAVAAGVYVAASAGNSGPGAQTVAHLGPWVSTTGASTHDRGAIDNELINMSGGGAPPADITGASRTAGYGPATIVHAGDFSNGDPNPEQCLSEFAPGTWTSGEIVMCDRGTIARVLKCANVAAGGAAGCVLGNVVAGTLAADPHVIPATHVGLADADALRAWLGSGAGHTATITAASITLDPSAADIMATFSSRGPNASFSTLKPDLTAPGVSIFAAFNSDGELPSPEFGTISGTSMSSPHNAGAGALMSSLLPAWSPSEIRSAIMMTAHTGVFKENGVTPGDPFDFGGGRIDLTKAAETGLVLDESHANYLAANPSLGGDPSTLNIASLQQNACVVDCVFTRTFTSVAAGSVDWDVTSTTPAGMTIVPTPSSFTLGPGASQEVEFVVDGPGLTLGVFEFAEIQLTELGASPDLHLPVAIRPAEDNFPDSIDIETSLQDSNQLSPGLETVTPITDLTLEVTGLVEGTQTDVSLSEDPTNGDPYDNLSQVFFKTVAVPAGAKRLVAMTESEEAPDVDLFVGTGATPSGATQVCASTTATASEVCNLTDPAAGTYWILVQNWAGSATQPDLIDLIDAVVPDASSGNLTADGPSIVASGDPFEIDFDWNLPSAEFGDVFFGTVAIGTDPGSPGNLGEIGIDLHFVYSETIFTDGFESGDVSAWSTSTP